jgi:glycosyltransferase involved in cell wall biosynthesis
MRIAHVTDCYLPRLGGIEMQVHDLAAHQIAAGHDVHVLTSTPETAGNQQDGVGAGTGTGLETGYVPVRRLANRGIDLPKAAGLVELSRAVRLDGFDAIHAHSSVFSPLAWSAVRTAARQGVPIVLTMHSLLQARSTVLGLSDHLVGWSRWPVVWTAVSEVAAASLRGVLGDEAVGVLPNGIDPQAWFTPGPRRPEGELTIASVMRLAPRKRPLTLLRTLAGIRALVPPEVALRAVLIGEGPQRTQLERSLRRSGMDSWVTLTGRLDRARIRPLLSTADVFLAPATQESFGIAALEARCAGLPVVAMAGGGVGEFIRHGQEGFLVHSDDEMVQVTADLLSSCRLRTMQEHNRLSAPDMTWPRVVRLSLDLYRRAGAGVAASRPEPGGV